MQTSIIQIFVGCNVYFHFQKLAHKLSIHCDQMPFMYAPNYLPLDYIVNHETKNFLAIMAHLCPQNTTQ